MLRVYPQHTYILDHMLLLMRSEYIPKCLGMSDDATAFEDIYALLCTYFYKVGCLDYVVRKFNIYADRVAELEKKRNRRRNRSANNQ